MLELICQVSRIRVIVIGAGPVGLTLTWLLARGLTVHRIGKPRFSPPPDSLLSKCDQIWFELVASLKSTKNEPDSDGLNRYERRRKAVVATDIIAQADARQRQISTTDSHSRQQELQRFQALHDDDSAVIEFLRGSSMLSGLEKAARIP